MKMIDTRKEVSTTENHKHYIIGINLKVPEELLIKIYDKIKLAYELEGCHPTLLILSKEYAAWFKELISINEYLKFDYNTVAKFNGLEIRVTSKPNVIEVY